MAGWVIGIWALADTATYRCLLADGGGASRANCSSSIILNHRPVSIRQVAGPASIEDSIFKVTIHYSLGPCLMSIVET